jgi:LmbE family N-acetylglucosaminyl deacetylase
VVSRLIKAGAGTTEADWAAWEELRRLPVLDTTTCRRAVVVAPHPDDETLAVGGLIAMLMARGEQVVLLSATDGEASHPGSPTVTPAGLRRIRARELDQALDALAAGTSGSMVLHRLGLPDGRLAAHEQELTAALLALLGPTDWCVAPFERDGHPDHEAAGRVAAKACAATGARLVSYPLWTWHWAQPRDPRVPWGRALRLPLPAAALRRKQDALACYPSQTEPLGPALEDAAVVPPSDVAHFQRPEEVLLA